MARDAPRQTAAAGDRPTCPHAEPYFTPRSRGPAGRRASGGRQPGGCTPLHMSADAVNTKSSGHTDQALSDRVRPRLAGEAGPQRAGRRPRCDRGRHRASGHGNTATERLVFINGEALSSVHFFLKSKAYLLKELFYAYCKTHNANSVASFSVPSGHICGTACSHLRPHAHVCETEVCSLPSKCGGHTFL